MTIQITAEAGPDLTFIRDGQWVSYEQVTGCFLDAARTAIVSSVFGAHEDFRKARGMGIHTGIDVVAPEGTQIYWDGPDGSAVVSGFDIAMGTGNRIVVQVEDKDGILWFIGIGHMRDRPLVKDGQPVARGQLIGYVGMTGTATGPHMHIWCGRALDYDTVPDEDVPGVQQEHSEFWISPRDEDGGVSRLVDIRNYFVADGRLKRAAPQLFGPPVVGDGFWITSVTRDVSYEDLEAIAHGDAISQLFVGVEGRAVGTPIGSPAFVWDALPFGGVVPKHTQILAYRR